MTKVLVVDDELDICLMVSTHLQKLQFETQYALSVKEAISKTDATVYQLLFIDIDLTDGSGFDVISHLQKTKSNLKIIVISAYHNEVNRALEMGADLFIAKPFSIKAINEALKTLNFLSL
jgi:DNA-binding response OmpR family regulator